MSSSASVAAGSPKYGLGVTSVPRALAGHGTMQNLLWDEDCTPHTNTPQNLTHHREVGLIWGLPCGYPKAMLY